jgi:TIR domain/CHAT domain/SEFIR domain
MSRCKVLFLAANPNAMARLALDEESREIEQKIRAAAHRLEFITKWAVYPKELLQYLIQHRPQLVHFSGHGSSNDGIILLDRDGRPMPVGEVVMKQLFTSFKDNIRVVVLNACFSRAQAEAIMEVIDCVVGMNKQIGDQAAIVFAASFYSAIGFGRSVQEAFEQGKVALMLEGIPEENTPQLFVRQGRDPWKIYLVGEAVSAGDSLTIKDNRLRNPDPAVSANHVFLSYSRESDAHAKIVRDLGEKLKAARLPVELDQFYLDEHPGGPSEGWAQWRSDRAEKSACMLVVCSKGWFDSYRGEDQSAIGFGAAREARVFRWFAYEGRGFHSRVRLVNVDNFNEAAIPDALKGWGVFRLSADAAEFIRMTQWIRDRLALPASSGTPREEFEQTIAERRQSELKERLDVNHLQKRGNVTRNEVFISCKNLDKDGVRTRDAEIAAEVYDFLTGKGLSVFLSTSTLEELGASDYTSAIDSALDSALVLLAIGTSTDHLESNWVKYEWNSFANAIRSGRKPNARIFTCIEGMPISDLPWGLQQTQTFLHGKGSLERLYTFISKALPPAGCSLVIRHGTQTHAGRSAAPCQAGTPTTSRRQVFISYSHKDKKWRDDLDTHLKPYLRVGSIVSWSDHQISPGSEWFREIQSALTNSKMAVLLVSPDFLASDFIHEHELGPLLKEAEQGGVKLLWIPVRESAYKQTPLKNYHTVLDPGKPLASMTRAKRDQAWVTICEEIQKAVEN